MRDEESGNTPTVNLLGAVRPKGKGDPSAALPDTGSQEAEADSADLEDEDDLVPAVRSFAVPPTSRPPPVPDRPSVSRPPSQKEEMTVQRDRPLDSELRARPTVRPPAQRPTWVRGMAWMLVSAVAGGGVMYVVMTMRARAEQPEEGAPGTSLAETPSAAGSTSTTPTAIATSIPTSLAASTVPAGSSVPSLAIASPSASAPVAAAIRAPTATAPPVRRVPIVSVDLLAAAAQARQDKQPARAREIYRTILGKTPDDIDALTGLADLARADGKSSDARAFYEHALAVDPNHGPAILGLADTLWDLDEKDAARGRYRDLLRRAPASSYPPRVENRAPP